MPWIKQENGAPGIQGAAGDAGNDGKPGKMGSDATITKTQEVNFSAFMSVDYLEDMLRQAEDDFAAERLESARSLLDFVRYASTQTVTK